MVIGVPDPAPAAPLPSIRQSFPCPPLPACKFSASYHVVGLDFYFGGFGPLARPLGFFHKTHPQVVIPMSSATHMQIFSILACRSAGFLFLAPWPAPWLFSQNAPTGCHSHVLSYPHANFQHPSMSFGWIFILGGFGPLVRPLDFFTKNFLVPLLRIPSATHMQIFSLLACPRDFMSVIKRSSAPPATFTMDLRLICGPTFAFSRHFWHGPAPYLRLMTDIRLFWPFWCEHGCA